MLLRNWNLALREGEGRREESQHHQVTRSNHGHHSPRGGKGGEGIEGNGEEGKREGKVRNEDMWSDRLRQSRNKSHACHAYQM